MIVEDQVKDPLSIAVAEIKKKKPLEIFELFNF